MAMLRNWQTPIFKNKNLIKNEIELGMQYCVNLKYFSQENNQTTYLHKISYTKVWRGCLVEENVEYAKNLNIVNMQYQVHLMNQPQENSYVWKKSPTKFWII